MSGAEESAVALCFDSASAGGESGRRLPAAHGDGELTRGLRFRTFGFRPCNVTVTARAKPT